LSNGMKSGQGDARRKENCDSRDSGSFVQKHTSEQMSFDSQEKRPPRKAEAVWFRCRTV
jgi:hypothetical protein